MKILGVDPGTNNLGYAILSIEKRSLHVLEHGVFRLRKMDSHQDKLYHIFKKIVEIIERFEPSEMAIEAPFHGKNVQSMLKLGRAQGVAIAAAMHKQILVQEYSPKKIKLAVTGNGNSSKEQVAAMVDQLVTTRIDRDLLDATDALATALCHHYQRKNPLGGGQNFTGWKAFIKANPDRLS
ncbi:MAG: crossover junction endodeoxyribonuclease RuvC [Saprospiraceae bacterium]|nr:crossover junction endodeoxyribonuclease RuvC [Saprospiraceae bacterium]